MAYNKNDIAQALSQIADADALLLKLTEFSETDPEALALFFQDETLMAALVKQLQENANLAELSYQNFLAALRQKNSAAILASLRADYDEDNALALGLLFQDPLKVNTLLQQLQEKGGLTELFSHFFAPALKHVNAQSDAANMLGGVFLCDALTKCWLDPRCKSAINDQAIAAVQNALSPDQAYLISKQLLQNFFSTPNLSKAIKENFWAMIELFMGAPFDQGMKTKLLYELATDYLLALTAQSAHFVGEELCQLLQLTWFRNQTHLDTLLAKLKSAKPDGLNSFFQNFFVPALRHFRSAAETSDDQFFLCDALISCMLSPESQGLLKAETGRALQQALSATQKGMILKILKNNAFIKEKLAHLSEKQFKKVLAQFSAIFPNTWEREDIFRSRRAHLTSFGTKNFNGLMHADDIHAVLQKMGENPKEASVHIKTWLQDKTQVHALLAKLAATNHSDALFSSVLIPALKYFQRNHYDAELTVLLCKTVAYALLSVKTMNLATVIALQQALSVEQARLITDQLCQVSIDEVGNMPQAQLNTIIKIIAKPNVAEQQELSTTLQHYFAGQLFLYAAKQAEAEFERSFASVASDKTWIVTLAQQRYVELFIKRFDNTFIAPSRHVIAKKYLQELADCLYNARLLQGHTGVTIIEGLQKTLSTQDAQTLSNFLTQDQDFSRLSTRQLTNMIAILSGNDAVQGNPDRVAVVHHFCMNYLQAATHSFSQTMPSDNQATFMAGLKSVPTVWERKALAELALKSNTPPSRAARWLVNLLPAWLCPDSLRERARPAVGFTPEHLATLQHIAENNGQLPEVIISTPAPITPVAVALPTIEEYNTAPAVAASAAITIPPTRKKNYKAKAKTVAALAPTPIPYRKAEEAEMVTASAPTILPVQTKVQCIRIPQEVKRTVGFDAPLTSATVAEKTARELPVAATPTGHKKVSVAENRYSVFNNSGRKTAGPTQKKTNQAISQSLPQKFSF